MNIDKKNRSQLKGYFVKNSIPTEQQFADLIDGMLNQKDDGIAKSSVAEPLSIQAAIDTTPTGLKKVINFYENFQDSNPPAWTLLLNPVIDSTPRSGFCISDGSSGASRLFIDKNTGNVGIGTVNPDATVKLHVNGSGKFTSLAWKNSILSDDQGGSIELGGNNAVAGVGTPFIDFHYSGKTEDFNVRLINDADKRLTVVGNLRVAGKGWIHDGSSNSAVTAGIMTNGSLTIGSTTTSFGGGTTELKTNENAAALLLETIANTEIAVHDYGTRVASLMYYEGEAVNRITIGRDMGWGTISSVRINGNLNVSSSSTPPTKNQFGVPDAVSGIRFTDNPGGGGQDAAWIQYYARNGEACTLEIGVSNDAEDHIALMPSGNVGIGITTPGARLDIIANSNTSWGSWPEAIRLSSVGAAAITHPGGSLLFGMHSNRNFYFADTVGDGKYVMTIDADKGYIKSPMWNVTQVFSNKNGGLPLSAKFKTGGGCLLIIASGSGWRSPTAGLIGMDIQIDDVTVGSAGLSTNEISSHKAFTCNPLVKGEVLAGTHSITLKAQNLTLTDINDRFSVTIIEFPFQPSQPI